MAERLSRSDPYRAVIGSRIRAQQAYPTSFRLDILGALFVGLTELGEVWVVFHGGRRIGGLDFRQILLVFGLSNLAFSTADMIAGHLDRIPDYIRSGTLEAFYLRPQPVLAQLMTSDFQLRRLSRVAVGLVAFVIGIFRNDIEWGFRTVGLLVMALICGVVIFAALFVCAGSLQFFLVNGAELTNSFTYGGSYAAQQPASVFPHPLMLLFGYLVPVVFVGYLPTLALLRLPGPAALPSWLVWLTPLVAVWIWGVALLLWRWGIRHYQGGGG